MTIKPFHVTSSFNPLRAATQAGLCAIIHGYLLPDERFLMGQAAAYGLPGDVQVTMTRVGDRFGLPSDAHTFKYSISSASFEVEVRCVWQADALFRPVLTHTAILGVTPDSCQGWSDLNAWLRYF